MITNLKVILIERYIIFFANVENIVFIGYLFILIDWDIHPDQNILKRMHEYFKKQFKFMQLKQQNRIIKVTYRQKKEEEKKRLSSITYSTCYF